MERIKDVIKNVITEISPERRQKQQDVLKLWQEMLGKEAFKHTKLIGFKNHKLLVNVDSSVWMFQLNLKRSYLLARLREALKDLEGIIFRMGSVK